MELPEARVSARSEEPAEVAANLLEDAYSSTCNLAGKLEREVRLVGSGLIGGAAEEIKKDPLRAGLQIAGTAVVGTVLTAAAIAEAPVIVTGLALTAGAVATGKWLCDTFDPTRPENQKRNQAVQQSMTETWNSSDEKTFQKNEKVMQANLGSLGLDLGSAIVGGAVAGRFAPAFATEIGAGCKAVSGAARAASAEIAQTLQASSVKLPALELACPGKAPSTSGNSSLSELVNFSKAHSRDEPVPIRRVQDTESPGPNEQHQARDGASQRLNPVEQPQATTRRPSTEKDFEEINRLQEKTFPYDELPELAPNQAEGIIALERPGHGIVGYAQLGMLEELTLLYMAVSPEHRACSKYLIKAVLDACRESGQWWFAYLKEDTAYPLFQSLAKDGYIKLKMAGPAHTHPRTGHKDNPVRFKVTSKEFTGERK